MRPYTHCRGTHTKSMQNLKIICSKSFSQTVFFLTCKTTHIHTKTSLVKSTKKKFIHRAPVSICSKNVNVVLIIIILLFCVWVLSLLHIPTFFSLSSLRFLNLSRLPKKYDGKLDKKANFIVELQKFKICFSSQTSKNCFKKLLELFIICQILAK